MTPRGAATTLLILLAALVWAPLGASSLTEPRLAVGAIPSRLPMTLPETSPSPGAGTAAPAPAVSLAAAATPVPAPTASVMVAATAVPAPTASVMVVAHAVPSAAKPAASAVAAGKSATPGTLRSATPAASSHSRSLSSPGPVNDHPAPAPLAPPGETETLPWLFAALSGLALVGGLLVFYGRRHPQAVRPVLAVHPGSTGPGRPAPRSAVSPDGSPMVERRQSARDLEGAVERRRPSRLQPADDPILSAMGLGPDAPAAGGARAVRARARRLRQGLEPRPEDEHPD